MEKVSNGVLVVVNPNERENWRNIGKRNDTIHVFSITF